MFTNITQEKLNIPYMSFEVSPAVDYDMQMHTYTPRRRGAMTRRLSFAPVRERSERLGIRSARELARRTGLNRRTAGKFWFNRVDEIKQLDIDVLLTLADHLECTPNELFFVVED